MGKNDLTSLSERVSQSKGQSGISGSGNRSGRIVYPAIVRDVDDKASQNRIRVEIVSLDEKGNIKGGKDKDTPLNKLPICIPLLPEFLHVRPKVGESVLIIMENPEDMTAPRYWVGPIRTSQTKMEFESYGQAQSIFNRSSFKNKAIFDSSTDSRNIKAASVIPQPQEIAIEGRDDADITFRKRETIIRAGKFKKNTIEINNTHPCKIQLKQIDDISNASQGALTTTIQNLNFTPYSQANVYATNINLISTEGKNRSVDSKTVETTTNSKNLERFGDVAKQLHPLVFGDDLIVLLKEIINFCLTHIHTSQKPAVAPLEGISKLSSYKNDEKIQEIISKNVRTN